jgi:creatinine amidohydrolase
MPENAIRYWQSLTTTDVTRAVERDPVVIMPLAAIEQHGPHLPLSPDLHIGMGLLASAFGLLADDFPACGIPPLAVGASEEHMHFPGTLSLAPETLSAASFTSMALLFLRAGSSGWCSATAMVQLSGIE